MGSSGWIQLAVLGAAILVSARVLGAYIARVFGGEPLREDRVFAPVERTIHRITGVNPEGEQRGRYFLTEPRMGYRFEFPAPGTEGLEGG